MEKPIPTSAPIDLSALSQKVADAVVFSRPQADTILMVCEQTGWDWEQAENFVLGIETQHLPRKLARIKLYLFMAGFTVILGGSSIFFYMGFLGFALLRGSMIQYGDWLSYFNFFDFWANGAPFFIGGMFFGLGMIAGGAYGIGKALAE